MKKQEPEDFWSGPIYTFNEGWIGCFIKRMRWYHRLWWAVKRLFVKDGVYRVTSYDEKTHTITINGKKFQDKP